MIQRPCVAILILGLSAPVLCAQPPAAPQATAPAQPLGVQELLQRLDALRSDPAAAAAPGSSAADQIDAVLGQLIASAPADDRCATWLIDRAAIQLTRLTADTSELSVMLGIPTKAQRRAVSDRARSALGLLVQARTAADEAARRLEAGLMGTGVKDAAAAAAQAAAVEARLSTLVDLELTQRIPFHEAWARALIAAAAESGDRTAALQAAAKSLAAVRVGTPAGESARQALLASTLYLAGGGSNSNSAASIRELMTQARAGAPDTTTRLRLAMLTTMLEGTATGSSADPSSASTGERLLLAEASARAALEAGRPGSPGWSERVAQACTLLLGAKDALAGATTDETTGLRLLIYSKVAQIIDPTVPAASLPPEALFARAVALASDDPASREVGMLFDQLAARTDLPAPLRADVLWEAGVHAGRQGDGADKRCPSSFISLATEFPADPRAPHAAWSAIERCGCAPSAPAVEGRIDAAACERLVQFAIDHPLKAVDPAAIDRWRAELLRLVWNRHAAAGWTQEGLDRVVRLWSELSPAQASKTAELTGPRRLLANMDQRGWLGIDAPKRLGIEQAALAWAVEIVHRNAAVGAAADLPILRLRIAEIKIGLGHKDAADDLRPLVDSATDAPGSSDRGRFRVLLGRALRLSGQADLAAAALRVFTDEFDAPGSGAPTARPATYWQAWAEMLEIQAATADATKTQAIDAQIKRLELIDPALGGDPATAARIRAARRPAG